MNEPWNRCDTCGRFIAIWDFGVRAVRRVVTQDTEFSAETYETLCPIHSVGHPSLEPDAP